jgi:hypothetical protein
MTTFQGKKSKMRGADTDHDHRDVLSHSRPKASAFLGPVTAKNVPIAFTSGAAIFSRFANWLLASSWVEREGMG